MVFRLPGRPPSSQRAAESQPVISDTTHLVSSSRPARSADFDRAHLRWSRLAQQPRAGLGLALAEGSTAAPPHGSTSSTGIFAVKQDDKDYDHQQHHDCSAQVPQCWVRTTSTFTNSDSAGSIQSGNPSPPFPTLPSGKPVSTASTPLGGPVPFQSPPSPAQSRPSLSDYGSSPNTRLSSHRWDYTELTALKQRFNLLDAEGKGWLSRAQFFDLFSSIVDDTVDDSTDHSSLFNFAYSLFYSSGEMLNLKEFVAGMTILSKGSEEERLRYLFLMYDADGSGYLNREEIRQVFRIMSSFAKSQDFKASDSMEGKSLARLRRGNKEIVEEMANKALAQHDQDGDGQIGFTDFSKWCSQDPVVKTWLDMLCHGTARGVARLRNEREQALLAQELSLLGFADKAFWRDSFALNASSQASSSVLPPTISSDLFNIPSSSAKSDNESGEIDSVPSNNLNISQSSEDSDTSSSCDGSSIRTPRHSRSLTLNAIGTFEIDFRHLDFEKEIGSGSFATVWKCRWLDSPVAVKVFRWGPKLLLDSSGKPVDMKEIAGDSSVDRMSRYQVDGESFEPEFDSVMGHSQYHEGEDDAIAEMANHRARFLQEVSLLKSIRHPNLLLYMGACVDPRYPLCIVSELIEGGSLFDCLHGPEKISLNLRQKVMLIQNIARGMLYLHGRVPVVLHRDLKSANILISMQNDGNYKATIIDFGLSKLNTTQASLVPGQERGMTGSLVTMAPEVMNAQKYQMGSDVYSFAIVSWEICCGRIPFGRMPHVTQLLMKVAVRGERPRFLKEDNIPSAVQALIRECWDQDVSNRPDFLAIANSLNLIKRDLGMSDGE
ncbi:Calcium-dependent Serine/threonine protein kinase [Chondrus crispus]|uniref:Calcium-dependent Serine/threonine protein kinase n=1 Tax=Chondrus crispus TaxID=2769 RepID=R7QB60_CHOCR|nr:Calcium-dependent Serine/threonine protein kinase [Chondrus crispus]CDF34978.1 Calcium-dependent Serine/threonine protein kinase [Chondrus crispus]|eukprot:XP_005714797.1 Calcium-dependent Serine/threonine protein kinase [Chondrus crispus]